MATVDDQQRQRALEEMDAVYDRYARPMEEEHWGEFVAVSPDGRTLLGPAARDVTLAAKEAFGTGSYVFRIGPRVVGRL